MAISLHSHLLTQQYEEKSQYEEKDKSSTWYCILCNQVLYCPPKKGRCWAFRSIGRTTGAVPEQTSSANWCEDVAGSQFPGRLEEPITCSLHMRSHSSW
jgi:hypothetical protein